MIELTTEQPADFPVIYELIKTGFLTAEVKDGTEQDAYRNIRRSQSFIPELSIVAKSGSEIVGHILLSRAWLGTEQGENIEMLLVAPLTVKAGWRNQGIATKLIETAINQAKAMNFRAIFLLGKIEFYQRFGFKAACEFNITYYQPIPPELIDNFMVLELKPSTLPSAGGILKLDWDW